MQREITQELVKQLLPERRADSNKGSYGSVLAAAGSMAYRGAAALCTEGALRGGAGLVFLASASRKFCAPKVTAYWCGPA